MHDCQIVLACDEGYAMPLATNLRSLVEANEGLWPLNIHVLTDGFSETARAKVASYSLPPSAASIRWLDLDLTPFIAFCTLPHVSKMTYARLTIPKSFPESISRILYVDTDTLVLGDLRPLWEVDLEGAVVGAALDGMDQKLKADQAGFEAVPRVQNYFNAGVLLIDLDRWRKERVSERSFEYLLRHPRSPFSDEDALNVACDGQWKPLDRKWNFQEHISKRIMDIPYAERPWIVHFVTDLKPWRASSNSLNASFYDAFRQRTRFARTPSQKVWDVLEGGYWRMISVLKRHALLRAIWSEIKAARLSAPTCK